MNGLSIKDINNRSTCLFKKDNKTSFMSKPNQIYLTKRIYILHKNNHGLLDYLQFKSIVPEHMNLWIFNKNINNYRELVNNGVDMLAYLNQMFIKDSYDLYEFKTNENLDTIPDKNVYKSVVNVGHYLDSDGHIYMTSKKPHEMTVEDIRNLDVWEEQTVEINGSNMRYGNQVPIWQKNMNIRHYDRGNEGYAHSIKNSSLEGKVYGYGDAMSNLFKLVNDKMKKSYNINAYT